MLLGYYTSYPKMPSLPYYVRAQYVDSTTLSDEVQLLVLPCH